MTRLVFISLMNRPPSPNSIAKSGRIEDYEVAQAAQPSQDEGLRKAGELYKAELEKMEKPNVKEARQGQGAERKKKSTSKDISSPMRLKVRRKHLAPEILDEYKLPWEWDSVSGFRRC